ncbi:MAG: tetratricopeptide repeat protein [Gemmatimonadales bacterium]|nr:tetratricopeptide repeat protein [Gemmatimonadales bacterium]
MNLEKLKDSARKFEQKEDWRRAIEVYLKAIQQIESGAESSPDLSLYNRVGDLYLKINDTAAAVRSYERAVDLYADQGFFNNAIALCGKILRVNPGRTQTYLKLAQLHARKNVVIEAKRNLIEFLERMNALGQLDPAFQSIKEFADQFSGAQDIRMMLIELLRAASRDEEALEQLAKIAGDLEAKGRPPAAPAAGDAGKSAADTPAARPPVHAPARGDLVFLDTGFDLPTAPKGHGTGPEGVPPPPPMADLVLQVEAPPPEGLEPTQFDALGPPGEPGAAFADAAPLLGIEQTADEDLETYPMDSLPGLELDAAAEVLEFEGAPLDELDRADAGGFETESADGLLDVPNDLDLTAAVNAADAAADSDMDLDFIEAVAPTAGLPLIDSAAAEPTAGELHELEDRIVDDPENPDLHRELADCLLLTGDLARSAEEMRLSLQGYERVEDWGGAWAIADRLVMLEPDAIHHHQKRVELAFRTGDRAPLLDAYLALGDALGRAGATDKALAVYGRVQEHDPDNARASAAIAALDPPRRSHDTMAASPSPASRPAPAPPSLPAPQPEALAAGSGDGFVDLGSMILEDAGPRDTRMRIDRREPHDEDEQREFKEILEQFKRGIDENLDTDDYQAHYDLGVAFKEMGLLDEAIAEFQKALRAPDGRLRTSEALGMAFFEKGQFAVSESVLRRAVEAEGGDEAKIGLIYWLGRALEAQGKGADAVTSYERAMAVDIRFMDLSDRIHRLTAGRRE